MIGGGRRSRRDSQSSRGGPMSQAKGKRVTRRKVLQGSGAAVATAAIASGARAEEPRLAADRAKAAHDGRLPQSLVYWCYKDAWKDVEQFARATKELGCRSLELIDPQHWPVLKKHGLTCAIAGSHGFVKGMNDPAHWAECSDVITKR